MNLRHVPGIELVPDGIFRGWGVTCLLWPWLCIGEKIQREVQERILEKKGNGHLQAMLVWSLVCKVLFCKTNWFERACIFFLLYIQNFAF